MTGVTTLTGQDAPAKVVLGAIIGFRIRVTDVRGAYTMTRGVPKVALG